MDAVGFAGKCALMPPSPMARPENCRISIASRAWAGRRLRNFLLVWICLIEILQVDAEMQKSNGMQSRDGWICRCIPVAGTFPALLVRAR